MKNWNLRNQGIKQKATRTKQKPSLPGGLPGCTSSKEPPADAGDIRDWVQSLGPEDALEEGMATHCSIRAWRTPWTKEPGGLQSMGSRRVGHAWAPHTHHDTAKTETSPASLLWGILHLWVCVETSTTCLSSADVARGELWRHLSISRRPSEGPLTARSAPSSSRGSHVPMSHSSCDWCSRTPPGNSVCELIMGKGLRLLGRSE